MQLFRIRNQFNSSALRAIESASRRPTLCFAVRDDDNNSGGGMTVHSSNLPAEVGKPKDLPARSAAEVIAEMAEKQNVLMQRKELAVTSEENKPGQGEEKVNIAADPMVQYAKWEVDYYFEGCRGYRTKHSLDGVSALMEWAVRRTIYLDNDGSERREWQEKNPLTPTATYILPPPEDITALPGEAAQYFRRAAEVLRHIAKKCDERAAEEEDSDGPID